MAVGTACDGGPGDSREDGISAEAFVAAYVDLRVRALRTPGGDVTDAGRDSILTSHGITEQDLLAFVERHGRDVPMISEVWDSVDSKLRQRREALREQADTAR
jgi:antitoxin (DNA-binding transcriptional repressor) of toxin-antitoxin stability system